MEKLPGDRTRALIIEPPLSAVSEDLPAEFAGGEFVNVTEVAQHLR